MPGLEPRGRGSEKIERQIEIEIEREGTYIYNICNVTPFPLVG